MLCSSSHSTQLVPLHRQQQQREQQQRHGEKWALLAAAGAAVAWGAAACWPQASSTGRYNQPPGPACPGGAGAVAGAVSPSAHQAASIAAGAAAGPLLALLGTAEQQTPSQMDVQRAAAAISAEASRLQPWALASAAWGIAMLAGEPLPPATLARLLRGLADAAVQMAPRDAAAAVWAAATLAAAAGTSSTLRSSARDADACDTRSTDLHASAATDTAVDATWTALLSVIAAAPTSAVDELAALQLLHAALQRAAAAAAASGNSGASAAGGRRLSPRASEEEVLAELALLPPAALARVQSAYRVCVCVCVCANTGMTLSAQSVFASHHHQAKLPSHHHQHPRSKQYMSICV